MTLGQMISGYNAAKSDFRVLKASDDPGKLSYLHKFSESKIGYTIEQFEFEGHYFSRSSLNFLMGLLLLKNYLSDELPCTSLEIGGGFGIHGEILSQSSLKNWRYIDIDIPPTATIAEWYLRQSVGNDLVKGHA